MAHNSDDHNDESPEGPWLSSSAPVVYAILHGGAQEVWWAREEEWPQRGGRVLVRDNMHGMTFVAECSYVCEDGHLHCDGEPPQQVSGMVEGWSWMNAHAPMGSTPAEGQPRMVH